jgi:hypothetical protein
MILIKGDKIFHFQIGDVINNVKCILRDSQKKKRLHDQFKYNRKCSFKGYYFVDDAFIAENMNRVRAVQKR